MRLLLPALLLAVSSASLAAPSEPTPRPQIVVAAGGKVPAVIPTSVKLTGSEFEILTLTGYTGGVTWDVTSTDSFIVPVELVELAAKEKVIGLRVGGEKPAKHEAPDGPSVAVFAVGTGNVTLAAWGIRDAKPVKLATFAVQANVGPRPPPIPPEPKPPEPKPPTPPAPIPEPGFRVLMVYESSDLSIYPAAQTAVLYSKEIRDYMTAKATKGPGGWAEWRVFDKDQPGDSDIWKAAMKRPRGKLPWIIISDGTTGYEGPLPANIADALALLKKYGG